MEEVEKEEEEAEGGVEEVRRRNEMEEMVEDGEGWRIKAIKEG